MKDEVLCLFTFALAALCFTVFVTVFKPTAISAIPEPNRREYCTKETSLGHWCLPHVFAAPSGVLFGRGNQRP